MNTLTSTKKKNSVPIFLLSFKKNILPLLFCLFPIFLILFSKSNLLAAKSGLTLWVNNVLPSLLPFFIATELLGYTNAIYKLGKLLNPIMRPVFNVPGIGSYPLLMGIISGYPTGAKIVTDLKENGLLTIEEAERLLAFTNNSGPLFILGTVGITMFSNSTIGILLLITHILSSLTVGIIFRFWKIKNKHNSIINNYTKTNTQNVCFSNLGEILGKSILASIKTIVMIGGFIVLFSVILSIMEKSNILDIISIIFFPFFNIFHVSDINFVNSFFTGILELTNGVMGIASITCKNISINIILTSFLLGFGGLSILLQVYSIISKANISIKPYIVGKLLHGILAAFYTFLFITYCPIFNFNL